MSNAHTLLTPKNIYRFLTGHLTWMSGPILSEKALRGMTLTRFWRGVLDMLVPEETLENLFPSDGRRPRAQSALMNRSGATSLPAHLRSALDSLNSDQFLALTEYLMDLLMRMNYQVVTFDYALQRFEEACFSGDIFLPELQKNLLTSLRGLAPEDTAGQYSPRLFRDALQLAWLSVFSLYGVSMNCEPLARLCVQEDTQAGFLWQSLTQRRSPHGISALSQLSDADRKLLRLLAMFSLRAWKTEELRELLPPLQAESVSEEKLTELAEKGLLKHQEEGWELPQLIAASLRESPYSAEEYPELWHGWAEYLAHSVDTKKQKIYDLALVALQRCAPRLNRDALNVLISLEMTAMTRELPRVSLPALHQQWLDSHDHTTDDEVTLHIVHMLWTVLGAEECFVSSAEALSSLPADALLCSPFYETLCNVLEIGGSRMEPEKLDSLFEHLRPDGQNPRQLAIYLNFLGGKQRGLDKKPLLALETLKQAQILVQPGSVEEAANQTRMAYALADLGRWEETLPLMGSVMENLRQRGYTEDSQTMVATRNSYLFFRSQCAELQQSLRELNESIDAMRAEGKEKTEDSQFALKHIADLYLRAGDLPMAEAAIREALAIPLPATAFASRVSVLLLAGEILCGCHKTVESLGFVTLAYELSLKNYGPENETTHRAGALKKQILEQAFSLGVTENESPVIGKNASSGKGQ